MSEESMCSTIVRLNAENNALKARTERLEKALEWALGQIIIRENWKPNDRGNYGEAKAVLEEGKK